MATGTDAFYLVDARFARPSPPTRPDGSRALAIDLAPSGIRVNVVSPGPVTTPGSREFSDALGASPELFAKEIPLGRYGSPDDIAEVVALLGSGRGKWMTGGIINVDGGMMAR